MTRVGCPCKGAPIPLHAEKASEHMDDKTQAEADMDANDPVLAAIDAELEYLRSRIAYLERRDGVAKGGD